MGVEDLLGSMVRMHQRVLRLRSHAGKKFPSPPAWKRRIRRGISRGQPSGRPNRRGSKKGEEYPHPSPQGTPGKGVPDSHLHVIHEAVFPAQGNGFPRQGEGQPQRGDEEDHRHRGEEGGSEEGEPAEECSENHDPREGKKTRARPGDPATPGGDPLVADLDRPHPGAGGMENQEVISSGNHDLAPLSAGERKYFQLAVRDIPPNGEDGLMERCGRPPMQGLTPFDPPVEGGEEKREPSPILRHRVHWVGEGAGLHLLRRLEFRGWSERFPRRTPKRVEERSLFRDSTAPAGAGPRDPDGVCAPMNCNRHANPATQRSGASILPHVPFENAETQSWSRRAPSGGRPTRSGGGWAGCQGRRHFAPRRPPSMVPPRCHPGRVGPSEFVDQGFHSAAGGLVRKPAPARTHVLPEVARIGGRRNRAGHRRV